MSQADVLSSAEKEALKQMSQEAHSDSEAGLSEDIAKLFKEASLTLEAEKQQWRWRSLLLRKEWELSKRSLVSIAIVLCGFIASLMVAWLAFNIGVGYLMVDAGMSVVVACAILTLVNVAILMTCVLSAMELASYIGFSRSWAQWVTS